MKQTIYIAGKVTGLPIHEVTMLFGDAQKKLQDKGFKVLNPLELVCLHGNGFHTDWQTAMKICLRSLTHADAVFLLPNWNDSKGAKLEHLLAGELGIYCTDSLYNLTSYFFANGNHLQSQG